MSVYYSEARTQSILKRAGRFLAKASRARAEEKERQRKERIAQAEANRKKKNYPRPKTNEELKRLGLNVRLRSTPMGDLEQLGAKISKAHGISREQGIDTAAYSVSHLGAQVLKNHQAFLETMEPYSPDPVAKAEIEQIVDSRISKGVDPELAVTPAEFEQYQRSLGLPALTEPE